MVVTVCSYQSLVQNLNGRQMCVRYLDEHGADHSQFVPQSNEPFDQEDAYIESH